MITKNETAEAAHDFLTELVATMFEARNTAGLLCHQTESGEHFEIFRKLDGLLKDCKTQEAVWRMKRYAKTKDE